VSELSDSRVDEVFSGRRETDRSRAAKVSRFIVRYSPIFVLIYTVIYTWLIASGFGWNTPKEKIDSVTVRVDSLVSYNRQSVAVRDRILDVLEILSVQPCLDLRKKNDPYVYRRLKCDEILKGVN
jgi:hypothetical protein